MKGISSIAKVALTSKKPGWRLLRYLVIVLLLLYGALMLMENSLIFFPTRYPAGEWDLQPYISPGAELATVIEDVSFAAADGTKLNGWLCRPHQPTADKQLESVKTEWLVLCFHGNAGNLSHRRQKISLLNQLPADVFIVDYRGYGKSEGSPSENGVYKDAQAAWDLLLARGYSPDRIIIHGTSLGGGPAVEMATRGSPAALVTEAAFTSIPDMAKVAYPFVPGFLVRTKFDNISKIGKVTCPKLIIHGTADQVVPFRMGEELFEDAAEPKSFYPVDGGTHDNAFIVGSEYLDRIRALVNLSPLDGPEEN